MATTNHVRRIVKLNGEPCACDLCGKTCRAKIAVMADGSRFGVDCGELVDAATSRILNGAAPWTERQARFSGAGDKQIAYLAARELVAA